jgi:DNA-binding transcriptional LysR family regulator
MPPMRWRVGGVPEHVNLPWHWVQEADGWRSLHLTVEWTEYPDGTGAMVRDLRAGVLDAAVVLTEGAAVALDDPALVLMGLQVRSPLTWGVHVHATSRWDSVEALAEARWAISRPGSGSQLMVQVEAERRGWPSATLGWVEVGTLEGARRALAAGQADAFLWEKYTTSPLVEAGAWRRVGEVKPPWPAFVVLARAGAVAADPRWPAVRAALQAQAARWLGQPGLIDEVVRRFGLSGSSARAWSAGIVWDFAGVEDAASAVALARAAMRR